MSIKLTNMLKRKMSVNNKSKQKVKDVGDRTTKPKSKRVQKKQPAKIVKQTMIKSGVKKMLTAQKGKSTTASQRLGHVDQVIDDVALGHVCVNGQDNPVATSLVAGPVTTPVNTCPTQWSNTAHNGGNVMTLQECAADAEVHLMNATNVNQQDVTCVELRQRPIFNERDLSNALRSVFGSFKIWQLLTSLSVQSTSSLHQILSLFASQFLQVASFASSVELRQRPIFNERDLSNALRSVFGSFSNEPGQSQVSVGIAPWNGDGRPMTSPRDAVPTGTNMPATLSGTTINMSSVPSPNEGPVDLSIPQPNASHRPSSMVTVPVTESVNNSERSSRDVSAIREQALKLQDTLLSQLERNKSVIQELQERCDSDASVPLSRSVPHEHDALLLQSSSEQQTASQRVISPTELPRGSGVGTISSVQSGPQQVTPQLAPNEQIDSEILVQPVVEPSDVNRGRKRHNDVASRRERTKK